MSAHSPTVVIEFCKLCDWAYQVWLNHRELFDDNPRTIELQKSLGADALARLCIISQEYALLQIAKLHDPAVVAGNQTLGIKYIVNKDGAWDQTTLAKLDDLMGKMNHFAKGLRGARNKALSHNDLAALLSGGTLGGFGKNEDVQYFELLQVFVNVVHSKVVGGPWPFNDLVTNDIAGLMAIIKS